METQDTKLPPRSTLEKLPWTKEENDNYIKENVEAFTDLITTKVIPELRNLLALLDSSKPCKQFQLALMDVDAMAENLASIREDGYLPRLADIPLESSEIQEELTFGEDEAELIYQDEVTTESGHTIETEGAPV